MFAIHYMSINFLDFFSSIDSTLFHAFIKEISLFWLFFFFFFFFYSFLFFFFFFQAEDGIRDLYVTGVQTCALPISPAHQSIEAFEKALEADDPTIPSSMVYAYAAIREGIPYANAAPNLTADRSEERRVGKECRSRWWAYE